MKKYLTTHFKKVNRFYDNTGNYRAKSLKTPRLEELYDSLIDTKVESLIMDSKKLTLLDEVVYKTRLHGVYHVTSENIRKKTGVGKDTLATFNKLLHESGEFIVARYRKRGCNCAGLVYIDIYHDNYEYAVHHLFDMDNMEVVEYLNNRIKLSFDYKERKKKLHSLKYTNHKNKRDDDDKGNENKPSHKKEKPTKKEKDQKPKDELDNLLLQIANQYGYEFKNRNKFYSAFKAVFNEFVNSFEEKDILLTCKKALIEAFNQSKTKVIKSLKNYGAKIFKNKMYDKLKKEEFAKENEYRKHKEKIIHGVEPVPTIDNNTDFDIEKEYDDLCCKIAIAKEQGIAINEVSYFQVALYRSRMKNNKEVNNVEINDEVLFEDNCDSSYIDRNYWLNREKSLREKFSVGM